MLDKLEARVDLNINIKFGSKACNVLFLLLVSFLEKFPLNLNFNIQKYYLIIYKNNIKLL